MADNSTPRLRLVYPPAEALSEPPPHWWDQRLDERARKQSCREPALREVAPDGRLWQDILPDERLERWQRADPNDPLYVAMADRVEQTLNTLMPGRLARQTTTPPTTGPDRSRGR